MSDTAGRNLTKDFLRIGRWLALAALSAWCLITGGIGPLWKWHRARDWIRIPCQMTRCEVVGHIRSRVDLEYQYNVGARELRGSRWNFSSAYLNRDAAETIAGQFRAGTKTHCWIDPEHPDNCVMDREIGWGPVFAAIFAGVMTVLFTLCAIGEGFAIRDRRIAFECPSSLDSTHGQFFGRRG